MEDNKLEEQLSGTVENVVFHNESNGYTVLEMNRDGELLTCVGNLVDVAPGEEVVFTGVWISHAVFGRQFKFSSCVRKLPENGAKLFRYLASGAVKGIGPKTAAKIVERFGEDAVDVLSNHPEKLAVIHGISKEKAVILSNEFNHQYSMRKVMIELENYGITASECTKIYKYFGMNALNVIKENPYALCGTVNGFGFDRAQKLCEDMKLNPDPRFRLRAGILYIIRHNLYANGHTCIPESKIFLPAENLLEADPQTVTDTVEDLIAAKQLVRWDREGEPYLFLPEIYAAEMSIADRMKATLRFPPARIASSEADVDRIEALNGIRYESLQRRAIRIAGEKGLLILTGGPGTGKTTAVKGIIRLFESSRVEVCLCAPTGMAAKRLSEVTGREAQTIHRLLEVEWDDSDKPAFRRDAQNPISAGAVIVDEVSMVDVELFASFLDALPIGCRLILVGDADQLPSVGPGNVLGDLIRSGTLPVVCLTEIFRQAQKSLIVMNAHRIIAGEIPTLDRADSDFFFMGRGSPQAAASAVTDLIERRLPDAYGFSPMEDIQILCPSKKGECGTVNLNRRLQEALNPPHQTKNQLTTAGGRIFREGDRVMQIRNNYNIRWIRGAEQGDGVFNGDIGRIKKINYAAGLMTVLFDDREAEYPTDGLSELELAYAVTVHKSQGSEYPVVILPLIDTPPMLLYRNLLYTAVTRAKKILVIVGRESKVTEMVRNNKTNRRYSALEYFLGEFPIYK